MTQGRLLEVRIQSIRYEARNIHSFEFHLPQGGDLPVFTAGSHIDLHLPNGLIRSYSLVNDSSERHRYVVAVQRDAKSRGGSAYVHDMLKVGGVLQISEPRNNFSLVEDAPHTLFIAGGIGITPIHCMIRRLEELGRSWELVYCARDRHSAAYLPELRKLGGEVQTNLHFNFDQEPGGQLLNIAEVANRMRDGAHIYCCGPLPMLSAFETATSKLPTERVHVEYFQASEQPAAEGGFQVELARTQRVVQVPRGKTILDALLDEGIDVPYSCMEGICGSCEIRVLEGVPDHRDLVLSKDEQTANDRMMVCCSGSKTERLVLDL